MEQTQPACLFVATWIWIMSLLSCSDMQGYITAQNSIIKPPHVYLHSNFKSCCIHWRGKSELLFFIFCFAINGKFLSAVKYFPQEKAMLYQYFFQCFIRWKVLN